MAHQNKQNRIRRNPNYKFHSEWHYRKHMEAMDRIERTEKTEQVVLGIVGAVVCVGFLIYLATVGP